MKKTDEKFHFNATWSMAVGGMVGGGIFSVLGVVVHKAGQWAWLSFVIAGLIALISAHSYSQLSLKYRKSGGAFTFLNEVDHERLAGGLSWVLILGYVLTLSVYAFTFGHYVGYVLDWGPWFPRVLALGVIALFAAINLRGVGDSSQVEIVTVWGKLIVLLGLAVLGLVLWKPSQLTAGIDPRSWTDALTGAAIIFMAYEGFQLLSYDYEDIDDPRRVLPRATLTAVLAVIAIYVLVALGATMLVGAGTLVEQEEVALAIAGRQAMGTAGLILVTIAAAFSTGSAINATLFSTARLMQSVAKKHDLPRFFARENAAHIPHFAILSIAGTATLLAAAGSLGTLVDAASLIFLITFGTVNYLAYRQRIAYRYLCLFGTIGCLAAVVVSSIEQVQTAPGAFAVVLIFLFLSLLGSSLLLKRKDDR